MTRELNFLKISFFLFLVCFGPASLSEKNFYININMEGLFSDLRDFDIRSRDSFKFVLFSGRNEVDISDFVTIIARAKKSKYNNFQLIDSTIKTKVLENYVPPLCDKADDSSKCKQETKKKIQKEITNLGRELRKKIRYPHWYHPMDTREGRKSLSGVREILTSKCPADCGKIRLDKGSQSEFDKLFPLIKKQQSSCLKGIIKNTAEQLKFNRLPASCEKHKTHPVCKSMSDNYRLFRDRLLRLTELVYGESARSQTEARLCLDCPRFSQREEAKALNPKELENIWREAENCAEIPPGKQKRVSSGTGLDREYIIRREKNGDYSVVLNLRFEAAQDYKGPSTESDVPSHYKKEVLECLEKANPKMLGPNNEKLRIILEEKPSGQSQCPEPERVIKIGRAGELSSSERYASDIDCPTVTHEILHQMGLCDEYLIEKRGYIMDSKTGEPVEEVENIHKVNPADGQKIVLKYNCRVTQTKLSIMKHHYERWNSVFQRKKESSLLTPRQFSAVLYGDCKGKNQLFNECSRLAYKNSFEDETCLEKKRKCETKQNAPDGRE